MGGALVMMDEVGRGLWAGLWSGGRDGDGLWGSGWGLWAGLW